MFQTIKIELRNAPFSIPSFLPILNFVKYPNFIKSSLMLCFSFYENLLPLSYQLPLLIHNKKASHSCHLFSLIWNQMHNWQKWSLKTSELNKLLKEKNNNFYLIKLALSYIRERISQIEEVNFRNKNEDNKTLFLILMYSFQQ